MRGTAEAGGWAAAPGTVRYTRDVAFRAHGVISLAMAVALSGSPAALAACVALCMQHPPTPAAQTAQVDAGHGAHSAMTAGAPASHAHHEASDATAADAAAMHMSGSLVTSDARLVATCGTCCDDQQATTAVARSVERSRAQSPSAPGPALVAAFHVPLAAYAVSPPGPPTPPRQCLKAPLALRI